MSDAQASLFDAEPLILARLRERLGPAVHVLSAPALERVLEGAQPSPAVYLIYQGGQVQQTQRTDGRAELLTVQWLALVATRNLADTASGASARSDASVLADRVLDALMGWRPFPGAALRLAGLPNPGFVKGYQWVPLVFDLPFTRRAPGN